MLSRALAPALAATLLLSACSLAPAPDEDATERPRTRHTPAVERRPPPPPPPCPREVTAFDGLDLVGRSAADVATDVAEVTHRCLEVAVVAPADDPAAAAVGAALAAANEVPLLLDDGDLDTRLAAFTDPDHGDPEVIRVDPGDDVTAAALEVAAAIDADTLVLADADRPGDLAGAALVAVRRGGAVVPITADTDVATLDGGRDRLAVGRIARDLGDEATAVPADEVWDTEVAGEVAWLLAAGDPAGPVIAAVAGRLGHAVVPVDGDDLRRGRKNVRRARAATAAGAAALLVGDVTHPERLPVLLAAPELPGGGLLHFEGTRMVALYGKPGTSALGALGEQDLDATFDRVRDVADGYDADGRSVVPTLEIIASVATVGGGDDGAYSAVTSPAELEDVVGRAAEEGVQVILDLQPGRTDFLTQARIFEDLLREPHVGLALDPEWRLTDDQVHLRQIGSVDAAEVQEVVDWLAELARDAGLSQKLLVLHQFRLSMLADRDTIELPPEVVAVVHADGQGPQASKLDTWRTVTAGAEDRWLWGWKNFYDEDPTLATPEEVLDLEPDVVLVTFQ